MKCMTPMMMMMMVGRQSSFPVFLCPCLSASPPTRSSVRGGTVTLRRLSPRTPPSEVTKQTTPISAVFPAIARESRPDDDRPSGLLREGSSSEQRASAPASPGKSPREESRLVVVRSALLLRVDDAREV